MIRILNILILSSFLALNACGDDDDGGDDKGGGDEGLFSVSEVQLSKASQNDLLGVWESALDRANGDQIAADFRVRFDRDLATLTVRCSENRRPLAYPTVVAKAKYDGQTFEILEEKEVSARVKTANGNEIDCLASWNKGSIPTDVIQDGYMYERPDKTGDWILRKIRD